ncbi:MAG: hypothetical protein HC814_06515 [Rhodobacteraceae bacterium]|nr:hypothetical protein [Paracoccaceae bacterium]
MLVDHRRCSKVTARPHLCPLLEVAEILRAGEATFRARYGYTLNSDQERVLREIPACAPR